MASFRRLKSGKWNVRVRHPSGKTICKTDPLKRVVVQWAADKEREFRTGAPLERAQKVTVGEWCERWLRTRRVEPTTAKKDASQLGAHVLPQWGDWPLASISRSDVQAWINDMDARGVGANTVTGAYHRLAAMLSDAVLEGLLASSPCREIDLPRVVRPAPRWLTKDEYGRIQLALLGQPRGHVWAAYVGLGCYSGLRPGELAGLDVEHVDFDRGLVRVQQVMTRAGLRAYPKSDSSQRSVPFPPEVGELLWRVIGDTGQGPVFTAAEGGRVNEANVRNRVWNRALEDAGVAPARPYITRHTAASWLIQAGVPDYEVARLLGHSSTRLVATYGHLAPDAHERVRAAWRDAHSTSGFDTVDMPASRALG